VALLIQWTAKFFVLVNPGLTCNDTHRGSASLLICYACAPTGAEAWRYQFLKQQ
jgi:hypothetical protein